MTEEKIQVFEGVDDGCTYIFVNHKGKGKVYKFENPEEVLTILETYTNKKLKEKINESIS